MFSIALLENGTFYLISRDYNQPIKRPEFNEVLYKIVCTCHPTQGQYGSTYDEYLTRFDNCLSILS